jgi:hypothetical protein
MAMARRISAPANREPRRRGDRRHLAGRLRPADAVQHRAKYLLLSHAFDVWGVHRVTLKTDARNIQSRRAIERLGAMFEGLRRADMPAQDGTVRDSAYYSIVRAEWPDVRARLGASLAR